MLTPEKLVEAFMSAKGDQTVKDVLQGADLPPMSISRIKRGHDLSLTRASKLAEAVGLEICIRPKGEAIDSVALGLAILREFVVIGEGSLEDVQALVPRLVESYSGFQDLFSDLSEADKQKVFEAAWLGMASALGDAPQGDKSRAKIAYESFCKRLDPKQD